MRGHKICFCGEIRLIITKLSQLPLLIWSTASEHSTYINGEVSGLFLWFVRVNLDGMSFFKLLHRRDHLRSSGGSLKLNNVQQINR